MRQKLPKQRYEDPDVNAEEQAQLMQAWEQQNPGAFGSGGMFAAAVDDEPVKPEKIKKQPVKVIKKHCAKRLRECRDHLQVLESGMMAILNLDEQDKTLAIHELKAVCEELDVLCAMLGCKPEDEDEEDEECDEDE